MHPEYVPQMADAEAVMRSVRRKPGVSYEALVPNARGAERALSVELTDLACGRGKRDLQSEERGSPSQLVQVVRRRLRASLAKRMSPSKAAWPTRSAARMKAASLKHAYTRSSSSLLISGLTKLGLLTPPGWQTPAKC